MKINPNNKPLSPEARAEKIRQDRIIRGELPTVEQSVDGLKSVSSALIGGDQVDEVTAARQLNRALCLFANTLPEEEAMVIASVYPPWENLRKYTPNEYVRYGFNADGEPQIYRVIQPHNSQSDWTPDVAVSLFKKIGFTDTGAALWVQPMGAHDAYQPGDEVVYNGVLYVSTAVDNVWAPDVYGWAVKAGNQGGGGNK